MSQTPRCVHFVLHGLEKTVVDSQLITPALRLKEQGVPLELVVMESIPAWLRLLWPAGRAAAEHRVKGLPLTVLPRVPRNIAGFNTIILGVWFLKECLRSHPMVVHCRGLQGAALWSAFKRVNPRLKVICDVRGVEADEYAYTSSHGGRRALNWFQSWHKRQLDRITMQALVKSDAILCVSDAMRTHLQALAPNVPMLRWTTVPCATDVSRFKSALEQRDSARAERGWADRIVLVYSGAFRDWQLPEVSVRCAALLRELDKRVFFYCLTPDVGPFRRLLEEAGIQPADCLVEHRPFEQVPPVLAACDIGLLLRQESPVNRFSCPTKFAEYLAANLFVLTTKAIDDVVRIVSANDIGWVLNKIDNLKDLKSELAVFLKEFEIRQARKKSGFELAERRLDWDRYIPHLKKLYLEPIP